MSQHDVIYVPLGAFVTFLCFFCAPFLFPSLSDWAGPVN
jgi:hypothetical protein